MPLPHTLLTLAAAAGLWWAGHLWSCSRPALQAHAAPPAFGIPDSLYGSLAARLIKDSLYSYWHGGEGAAAPSPADGKPRPDDSAPPPPPPPGRFARRGQPPPPPPPAAAAPVIHQDLSWLDRRIMDLARLEKQRTKRNSPFPPTAAHQRYLTAAADWRLRLAFKLDPGDPALYEILHFQILSHAASPEAAAAEAAALAESAMAHGLRSQGSLSDALTGAGAAINRLNELLRPEVQVRDVTTVRRCWDVLQQSLARYHILRAEAEAQGWWRDVPPVRQKDLDEHARMLGGIAASIHKQISAPGF